MRIAYANVPYRRDKPSGRNVHIEQFLNNALALGHKVWTWPGDQTPAGDRLPQGRLQLLQALRRMDVLYVRLSRSPSLFCRWAVAPYRQALGSPLMVWEINTLPTLVSGGGRSDLVGDEAVRVLRRYGRGCDLAICVSDMLADYAREELGIQRALVVPNGSDPDLFSPDVAPVRPVERSPGRLNVAWIVGSADLGWHNFDLLRRAADMLWERDGSRIEFHIIGQASASLMRDMPPSVHAWGPEEYTQVPRWLAAMDVGLALYSPGPADYGSPLKLFDYMSSGLAVVATRQPQTRQVFEQLGDPGLLIPPDDPAALAHVLVELAQDSDRVHRHGHAGRQLVISYYNWRRAVEDSLREVEAMLEERRVRHRDAVGKMERDHIGGGDA